MASATKPFRVKYAPPGITWAEAKAAGALRESEVLMIRYRVQAAPVGRARRRPTTKKRRRSCASVSRPPIRVRSLLQRRAG